MKISFFAFALLAVAAAAVHAEEASARFRVVAQKLAAGINAGSPRVVYAMFSPDMKAALPLEKAEDFFNGIHRQSGALHVGPVALKGGAAAVVMAGPRASWNVSLALDEKDRINGLLFKPAAGSEPVPRAATPMRLPFEGEWFVVWGGPTEAQNYHVPTRSQRRALDLVVHDARGSSHSGDGASNSDYYCYGKAILAPAAGTVETVVNGVTENAPGTMNPFMAVGNCVILRLSGHEFALFAHLQPGSITVKPGDTVMAGRKLGLCGNSGNSSEPHLHFHVQDAASMPNAAGLTPYFQNVSVTRAGKTTIETDYTPLQGDVIRAR